MAGLLTSIGTGLNGLFSGLSNPKTQTALAAARAFADGDYGAGARIQMAGNEFALDKQKQEAALKQRQELFDAARAVITDPAEWAEFISNPEKWGEERLGRRHGFQSLSEGESGFWGDPGIEGSTQRTAPKTIEVGPDLISIDPDNILGAIPDPTPAPGGGPDGLSERMREVWDSVLGPEPSAAPSMQTGPVKKLHAGRTDMERYAEQFGEPGSDAYKQALQDWRLTSFGPTAYTNRDKLQDDALSQSNTNNQRNNTTSRANTQDRVNQSDKNNQRDNTTRRDAAKQNNDVRLRLKGKRVSGQPISGNEAIARYPDGTVRVARNGQWVPTGERWK